MQAMRVLFLGCSIIALGGSANVLAQKSSVESKYRDRSHAASTHGHSRASSFGG